MKKSCFMLSLLMIAQLALAVPAKKEWRTVTQSDGTTITVMLCGDETFHYYKTTDDVPLVLTSSGDYCYANTMGFSLTSTGVIAHEDSLRSPNERLQVSSADNLPAMRMNAARSSTERQQDIANRISKTKSMSDGKERHGLVIMVSFTDRDFRNASAYKDWNAILNEDGYSDNGANGSVHNYFYDQSQGMFNLKFDCVGPIQMPKASTYYGKNSGRTVDINAGEMVATACTAADAYVNFKDYDWDGDGYVDQVYILYAGYGEHYSGNSANLLWPHEYQLSAFSAYRDLTIDGVKINTYACGSELAGWERDGKTDLSGIGTFCHEFSHCLGIPDFYVTDDYADGLDMLGDWDLMSSGAYNNSGWCPPNYTSYEKELSGWITPTVLTEPTTVTDMESISQNGDVYKVINDCDDNNVDEYYLLENRQKIGWDKYIPGQGLMVLHVDYNKARWENNTVNNYRETPGVGYIPANGRSNTPERWGYPYGTTGNSLTDTSSPKAAVHHTNKQGTKLMGKPITNIAASDEYTASFDFCKGSTSGINDIQTVTDENALYGQPATIYDVQGRKIATTQSYNGVNGMAQGMYIVRGYNGQTLKIMNSK